jgi:dimethylamine/trimethylamine dehydrogenase
MAVFGPEDVFAGRAIDGPVLVYDDDRYYMGGVLAEQLRLQGREVTLVTPAADVSSWSHATLEQGWIEARLHEIGVTIIEKHGLVAAEKGAVEIEHVASGRRRSLPCAALLLVTMRLPNDALFHALDAAPERLAAAGIRSVKRIGDCLAPSTIAAAVYAGHRCARETDEPATEEVPFKRELVALLE